MSLITEEIDSTYARIRQPFRYASDLLGCIIEVPVGFVFDYESVRVVKATSKRGGAIHDYLCRSNSVPVVTKKMAADVYFEAMELRDRALKKTLFSRIDGWIRRWIKYWIVRVAWGYFHRYRVEATYEKLTGKKESGR